MITVQQQASEPACYGCRHLITANVGNSHLYRCAQFDAPHGWRGLDRSGRTIHVPRPEVEDCWQPIIVTGARK